MLFSKIIEKKFDEVLGRYDGNPAHYYFSSLKETGMKREAFRVKGTRGNLNGYFYYATELNPEKLVIFDHGIGAGHLAYLREIACLVKHGYTVYAYDHTGCVESDGEGILGFAQGVNDLDHVISTLHLDHRFWNAGIKIVGHSWGGYSAMNAAAFHPEVSHVVSLAGFISAKELIEQYLPKFVLKYSAEVMDREREHNPMYADLDARESLKNTETKLLHFQSRDDSMVSYSRSAALLQKAFQNRPDTMIVTLDHKDHEPQRTEEAAEEGLRLKQQWQSMTKKTGTVTDEQMNFVKAQDWNLLTRQDPAVWDRIFTFLEH